MVLRKAVPALWLWPREQNLVSSYPNSGMCPEPSSKLPQRRTEQTSSIFKPESLRQAQLVFWCECFHIVCVWTYLNMLLNLVPRLFFQHDNGTKVIHIQQNCIFLNFEFWASPRPVISGSVLPQLHGTVAPQLRGRHCPWGGCRHSPAGLPLRLLLPKTVLHDYGSQVYNIDMQMKHL